MGFAGELTTIGLPEVFRNIAFSRLTGVLAVTTDGRGAEVYFEEGMIRAVHGRTLDYETIAERAGAAPVDVIEQARGRARRTTLRETLRSSDEFVEESFDNGIRAAIEEEAILLFGWTTASFVFEEGPPKKNQFEVEQLDCRVTIHPDQLAAEAARRQDAWHAINTQIGSEAEIFVAQPDAVENPTPEAQAIMGRLDGTRDLRTALQILPFERFHMLHLVSDLIESGAVVPASADHLRELAAAARNAGQVNRAAQLLEEATRRDPADPGAHRELVALFEGSGRPRDAAGAYKRLAQVEHDRGDVKSALAAYHEVLRLVPYDAESLERIVELHDARGDLRAMLVAGRRLADMHSSQGRHEQSTKVLGELLARDPQNVGLREAIAANYIKMHEPQNAAQELLSLAESASAADGNDRALHYYRSVLAVDRSCSVAAARINEIEQAHRRTRSRARRRRMIAAFLALVVGGGAWQSTRELQAQGALDNATQMATEHDAIEAMRGYAQICKAYPMTLGAKRAEDIMRALLLSEVHRARADPSEARQVLRRLGNIEYPERLMDLWRDARDGIVTALEAPK